MLAGFTTEREDVVLAGRETILRNGEFAGYLTSGGYGYTVGKPIGFGYVRNPPGVDEAYLRAGSYELVVATEVVKAQIHWVRCMIRATCGSGTRPERSRSMAAIAKSQIALIRVQLHSVRQSLTTCGLSLICT